MDAARRRAVRLAYCQDRQATEGLCQWVGARIPHAHNLAFDPNAVAIGVVSDVGNLVAGVVFNTYIPDDSTIQVHLAADNPLWCRGNIIRDILAYPFYQLSVNKVWGATPIDMEHVLSVNRKMGFVREAVLRYHVAGKHAVITGMLRKEYLRKYWPERSRVAA